MRYVLAEVERFPKPIEPGKLYWSREFSISAHLCACGCGDTVYLPVGPVDYAITIDPRGPTVRPSVGNWNVCNAHYFITNGEVEWASRWTADQISAAREHEDAVRSAHYDKRPPTIWSRVWRVAARVLRFLGSGRR